MLPESVCVEPFGPGDIVSEDGGQGESGTDLPECTFADHLE